MKKKICFFSGDITNSGGTEKVATLIINELVKDDRYDISVISLVEKKNSLFFYLDERVNHTALYEKEVRGLTHMSGIINRTRKYVRANSIDVVVDIDGILDMYTLPVKMMTSVKVISWEHYNFYQNPYVPYRRYTRMMAAKWADAIVTLTKEDQGYYRDNLQIKGKLKNIYNPIIWNGTHEYDYTSKNIISVGRLSYQKGFDYLLEVAHLFLNKYPDWKWTILGEGEERESLESKIKEYGLQSQIDMPGNVSNIDDYYSRASFFVMTSRFEGLPMTLLETKPYKLPIVSFDCKTGPSELIEDGVNGYLIKELDFKEMAEKIEKLINDEKLRIEFSEHAQDNISNYDLNNIVNEWKKLIDCL